MTETFILIADGSRARLLSQDLSGHLVELHSWDSQGSRREPHDLESDRSGQAGRGKEMEHADPQHRAKFLFASRLAEELKLPEHLEKAMSARRA